jgi:sugar lactone lactonase YvrE
MSLELPGPGGMLDAMRSWTPSPGRPASLARALRRNLALLLPVLLLALGGGCHHHANPNAVGIPPAITLQPVDSGTVTGRPVTFTVTATGAPALAYQWAKDGVDILGALGASFTLYTPQASDAGHYSVTISNDYGSVTSYAATLTVAPALQFTAAVSLVVDASGNLFVSDRDDHVIWQVSPAKQVTLLAGSQGAPGSADGKGSGAQFRNPGCLAFDPAGNLLVADTGNHTIRRVAMDGTVTTLAGTPGVSGSANGVGAQAQFSGPYGIAVAPSGMAYVSDTQNHTIRLLAPDGTVTTLAGTPGASGQSNGSAVAAQFDQPNGLTLGPDGSLYIADYGNACIRVISPAGQVSTLAGTAGTTGYLDATGTAALFNGPVGITLDPSGNLWVTDTHNHAVRRIAPGGVVNVIVGSGVAGNADGTGTLALFDLPTGITYVSTGYMAGNFVVADTANHILRLVTPGGIVTTL